MSQGHSPALEQALAAFRAPGLFLRLRDRALPDDLLLLLRIAAGEARVRELACTISREPEAVVVEAATLFVQQVMFTPGSDSYRVLGVTAQAAGSQIKEHHRWLVRWLHPDRNADDWDAVYADRVNRAWQDLRTPERRRDYDASRMAGASLVRSDARIRPADRSAASRQASGEFLLSARAARRLPMLILGSLAVGAVAVLGLQYYLLQLEAAEAIAATPTAEPTAVLPETPMPRAIPAITAAATPLAPTTVPAPAPVGAALAAMPLNLHPPTPAKPIIRLAATPPPTQTRQTPTASAPSVEPVAVAVAVTKSAPLEPGAPQPAPTPSSPALIDELIAQDLILRFRNAYASGNIDQVRSLLSTEAHGRRSDRRAILRSYGELFESSASRRIDIRNASWLTDGDTAILIASYEAWIVPRGQTQGRRFTGDIRFDLLRENGQLRIIRLRHESARS